MRAPAPRGLMVGTALEGSGGVATVVSVSRRYDLCERASVRHQAPHCDGTPCVKARQSSSDWHASPSHAETLRDGDNGLLVPSRDEQALARALARLLGDDALGDRLAERARNHRTTLLNRGGMRTIVRDPP